MQKINGDLYYEICRHLRPRDIGNLAVTCQQFSQYYFKKEIQKLLEKKSEKQILFLQRFKEKNGETFWRIPEGEYPDLISGIHLRIPNSRLDKKTLDKLMQMESDNYAHHAFIEEINNKTITTFVNNVIVDRTYCFAVFQPYIDGKYAKVPLALFPRNNDWVPINRQNLNFVVRMTGSDSTDEIFVYERSLKRNEKGLLENRVI